MISLSKGLLGICLLGENKRDLSHVPSNEWEQDNKDKAQQDYIARSIAHIIVNPLYPHLGASPDGIINCTTVAVEKDY